MSAIAKIWIAILLGAVVAYGVHTAIRVQQARDADALADQQTKPIELKPDPQPMPQLAKVELIERSGANFHFNQLEGKVFVVNMFYSTCTKECSQLMQTVRSLQHQYKNVQFVSMTCDPDKDTPQRLREYAAALSPDGDRWSFITGDMNEIGKASQALFGFKVAREQHSQYLTLVNERGEFVEMYHALTSKGITDLTQKLDAMVKASAPEPTAAAAAAAKNSSAATQGNQ